MQITFTRLQITPTKNYNPSYQPQMLGKVLVAFQSETHENASDAPKPVSAACGEGWDVFC